MELETRLHSAVNRFTLDELQAWNPTVAAVQLEKKLPTPIRFMPETHLHTAQYRTIERHSCVAHIVLSKARSYAYYIF